MGLWTHCLTPLCFFPALFEYRYDENLDLNKVMFEKYLTLLVMEGVSVLVRRKPTLPVPSGWLSYQQNGTAEVLSCIAHDICPCLNKWLCLKGFIEWTLETPVLVNSGVFISPRVYVQWGRWFVLEIFWVLPIYHRFIHIIWSNSPGEPRCQLLLLLLLFVVKQGDRKWIRHPEDSQLRVGCTTFFSETA